MTVAECAEGASSRELIPWRLGHLGGQGYERLSVSVLPPLQQSSLPSHPSIYIGSSILGAAPSSPGPSAVLCEMK